MNCKKLFALIAVQFLMAAGLYAQTNLQTLYDFGSDREHVTTTLEGFYGDRWGNTFFFIDHDFNSKTTDGRVYAPSGTYMEIARCLNFWKDSALSALSLQLEYNGGVYNGYTINNAFLTGADFFIHSSDFSKTFNIKLLYKYIHYLDDGMKSKLPLQLTAVWGINRLFGVDGLSFSGFADFWWEDHMLFTKASGEAFSQPELSHIVFLSEPQLWYNVGRHFGVQNLNVGGEVELSLDFGTVKGFKARPCLGTKWVF